MKFLFALIGILAFVAAAFCADCEYDGKSLKIGETYVVAGTCSVMECVAKGEMIGTACPSEDALPPCKVIEDKTKVFPECCPKAVCPGDKGY